MARDSSGNYSLPGSAFVTGQTADATAVNAKLNDLAAEITDSLSRSGKGGLTQPLKLPDGAVAAPGLSFTQETGSGLYRAGAGDVGLARLGVKVFGTIAGGVGALFWGTLTATSAILKGAVADGASAVGVILDNSVALANAGAKLLSVRNAGVEAFYLNKDGVVGSKTFLPSVGQQISSGSGLFSTTSASLADVTNLSVTISTVGRPVFLALQARSNDEGAIGATASAGATSVHAEFAFVRDATVLSTHNLIVSGTANLTNQVPSGPTYLDAVAAGTYTYKVQARAVSANTSALVRDMHLVAYEL